MYRDGGNYKTSGEDYFTNKQNIKPEDVWNLLYEHNLVDDGIMVEDYGIESIAPISNEFLYVDPNSLDHSYCEIQAVDSESLEKPPKDNTDLVDISEVMDWVRKGGMTEEVERRKIAAADIGIKQGLDLHKNHIALHLYNGCDTLEEFTTKEDWGEHSIVLNNLSGVFSTYGSIRVGRDHCELCDLRFEEGCLYYDGKWYGDWEVVVSGQIDKEHIPFDETKCSSPTSKKPSVYDEVKKLRSILNNIWTDANMALDGNWDKSDDGFQCQIDLIEDAASEFGFKLTTQPVT